MTNPEPKFSINGIADNAPVADLPAWTRSLASEFNSMGSDVDWLSSRTTPITAGGTGATTAANARTNLGLGGAATLASPIPVANGGTGATTAANARTALGIRAGGAVVTTNAQGMGQVAVDLGSGASISNTAVLLIPAVAVAEDLTLIMTETVNSMGFNFNLYRNGALLGNRNIRVFWIAVRFA